MLHCVWLAPEYVFAFPDFVITESLLRLVTTSREPPNELHAKFVYSRGHHGVYYDQVTHPAPSRNIHCFVLACFCCQFHLAVFT